MVRGGIFRDSDIGSTETFDLLVLPRSHIPHSNQEGQRGPGVLVRQSMIEGRVPTEMPLLLQMTIMPPVLEAFLL
jgi:hypothetical protein